MIAKETSTQSSWDILVVSMYSIESWEFIYSQRTSEGPVDRKLLNIEEDCLKKDQSDKISCWKWEGWEIYSDEYGGGLT